MPSNSAQQTQQQQQSQQLQAEQYAAQQRQLAEQQWADFFKSNPSPASTWGKITPPSFAGSPATIGGGSINGKGKLSDAVASGAPPSKAKPG